MKLLLLPQLFAVVCLRSSQSVKETRKFRPPRLDSISASTLQFAELLSLVVIFLLPVPSQPF